MHRPSFKISISQTRLQKWSQQFGFYEHCLRSVSDFDGKNVIVVIAGRSATGLAGAKGRRRSREPGAERQTSRAVPHSSTHLPCASRGAGTSGAASAGLSLVAQDAGYGDTIKNASENTGR